MEKIDRRFWQRLKTAKDPLLILDYDGTLAPFRVERMEARPLPGIPEVLSYITGQGLARLAVVSGRPVAELVELMGEAAHRIVLSGAHGWEWREPGQQTQAEKISPQIDSSLANARELALVSGGRLLGDEREARKRVERKTASVAVHVRGLGPQKAGEWMAQIEKLWSPLTGVELELMFFKGGAEIRAAKNNKGEAVNTLLQRHPGADLVIYMGDDRTDEDAFRALPDNGVGIRVGEPPAESAARYRVEGIEGVLEFLETVEHTLLEARKGKRNE